MNLTKFTFQNITFIFVLILAVSAPTSIFFIEVGYFGAFLILVSAAVYKKEFSAFKKSGIEQVIILFLLFGLVTALLSQNFSESIGNTLSRMMFFPIVYTLLFAIKDEKGTKTALYLYLAAGIVHAVIYTFSSYEYYTKGLYALYASGPAPLIPAIETSQILSFIGIFLIAIVLSKKTTFTVRLISIISLFFVAFAMYSTYKRGGWIGFAAGAVLLLILYRKWFYIVAGSLALIVLISFQQNINKIHLFSFDEANSRTLTSEKNIQQLFVMNDTVYALSFDGNIFSVSETDTVKTKIPEGINNITKWRDFYCLHSADNFYILSEYRDSQFTLSDTFYTNGINIRQTSDSSNFYVLDMDGTVTVFNDPNDLANRFSFNVPEKNQEIAILSPLIMSYGNDEYSILYEFTEDGIDSLQSFCEGYRFVGFVDSLIYLNVDSTLIIYQFSDGKADTRPVYGETLRLRSLYPSGNQLFGVTEKNLLISFDSNLHSEVLDTLTFAPSSVSISSEYVALLEKKNSRILSIFSTESGSNRTRVKLWSAGLSVFYDHPFFGVGDVSFAEVLQTYSKPYDNEIHGHGHVHNTIIQLLASYGIFGAIAFLLLIIVLFRHLSDVLRRTAEHDFSNTMIKAMMGCLVAFLVTGLVDYNFGDFEISTNFWFIFGMSFVIKNITENRE